MLLCMQASQSHPGQGDRGKIAAWRLVDGVVYSLESLHAAERQRPQTRRMAVGRSPRSQINRSLAARGSAPLAPPDTTGQRTCYMLVACVALRAAFRFYFTNYITLLLGKRGLGAGAPKSEVHASHSNLIAAHETAVYVSLHGKRTPINQLRVVHEASMQPSCSASLYIPLHCTPYLWRER